MTNKPHNWRQIWMDARHLLHDPKIADARPSTAQLAAMIFGCNRITGSTDKLPPLRLLTKYMTIRARKGRLPDDIAAEQVQDGYLGNHFYWRLK